MSEPKSLAYEIRVVVLLGLAYGFAFYDRMAMSFLSPMVQKDFNLNNAQIGALGSGLSLTWALGAYFIGRWSDKLGVRKPFLLGAMLIFSACSVLSGLSVDFWSLLATRILMGAVEGPFLPICLAFIASASPDHRRGLNSGLVQNVAGGLLGNAVAPIVIVWSRSIGAGRSSFFLAGLPGIILFFIVWKFIKEPPKPAPVPAGETDKGTSDPRSAQRAQHRALRGAMSPLLIGTLILGSIFMPLYLTQVRGFSNETMSFRHGRDRHLPGAGRDHLHQHLGPDRPQAADDRRAPPSLRASRWAPST